MLRGEKIAQVALEDLARGIARQRFARDVEVRRNLEVCEALAEERPESIEVDLGTVPLSEAARAAIMADPALAELAWTGGDDYEILCAVPQGEFPAMAEAAAAAGIALILGVDRILDMARTAANVTGDVTVSAIVAASEGQLTPVGGAAVHEG